MVPITLFNRGQAGKIFGEVKKGAAKIVVKNNEPEAVIISPEEYKSLQERIENLELAKLALERQANDNGICYSEKEVMEKCGITETDLEGWEDVELE